MTLHEDITAYLRQRAPDGYKVTWLVPESFSTLDEASSKLIVIEQAGASVSRFSQSATFAIDVYAASLKACERVAYQVADMLSDMYDLVPRVIDVGILSIYSNPLLDEHYPRYTVNVSVESFNH